MGRAKEILVKVIPSKVANEFVKLNHYSGKVVPNSTLHFGCFLDDKMHGVMSYGPSINKKGTINLVEGTGWNEFIELNRMAFDEYLPKYSESRCIAISIKLIKKNAPQIKWIISFADGTQCGDGTIYRASGFNLVGIAISGQVFNFNGEIVLEPLYEMYRTNEKKKQLSYGEIVLSFFSSLKFLFSMIYVIILVSNYIVSFNKNHFFSSLKTTILAIFYIIMSPFSLSIIHYCFQEKLGNNEKILSILQLFSTLFCVFFTFYYITFVYS